MKVMGVKATQSSQERNRFPKPTRQHLCSHGSHGGFHACHHRPVDGAIVNQVHLGGETTGAIVNQVPRG